MAQKVDNNTKRIICDCCSSDYQDYARTEKNSEQEVVYLCTMCKENVREDIVSGKGEYSTPSGARHTAKELDEMENNRYIFAQENEQIDGGNL